MTQELIWLSITGKLPCLFHELTGLYCPGCGGTRAFKAFLQGRLLVSFFYHPLVLYCVFVAMVFAASYLIYWKTKNRKFRLYLENGWIYGGLAVVAVNLIVKNYLLLVEGMDVLAMLPKV